MLGSFRKQGIVASFFALEYEVGKMKLTTFNAVKLNFVAIFVFFVAAASSI